MAYSFERVIEALKHTNENFPEMEVKGPLSNGDYSILFKDNVKIIVFPNIEQRDGRVVMDFVCIPQANSYDLIHTYDISEIMLTYLPGRNYLFDIATIERSMSRTACIRFSLDHEILNEVDLFLETIEFMKLNTNIILQKQLEHA